MTQTKVRNYQIASTIFASVLGTLLHFTYEFFEKSIFVSFFSAVNESVWEHLKLLFFPMLLTTMIGYFYLSKDVPHFLCAKVWGILTSMMFIIIFFYTYTGVVGRSFTFIDIASFFMAVILGEYLAYKDRYRDSFRKCRDGSERISRQFRDHFDQHGNFIESTL